MTAIKAIIRDDYKKRNGKSPVLIQLYYKSARIKLKTGVEVEPDLWDKKNGIVRKNNKRADELNMIIEKCRSTVNDIFILYRLRQSILTPEKIKEEYKNFSNDNSFKLWALTEVESRKDSIEPKTYRNHKSMFEKFCNWKPNITFADISYQLIEDYDNYMKIAKGNNLTTRHSNIKVIKQYLQRAVRRGIIRENPLESFKIRQGTSTRVYCDEVEVEKFWYLYDSEDFKTNKLKMILRTYLFQCETGLRFGDVRNCEYDFIVNNKLVYTPGKTKGITGQTVTMPLTKRANQLIADAGKHRIKGKIFSTYTEPTVNRKLKEIAQIAGIKKRLTTHTGRHTFATIFWERTKDLATLQQLLGHADIRQTMIYTHVSNKLKIEQMKLFETKSSNCFFDDI